MGHFNPRSRAGSDLFLLPAFLFVVHFNPRFPCGKRQQKKPKQIISIHAALAGGDRITNQSLCVQRDFNPRRPCGRRRKEIRPHRKSDYFNPRRPCGRRQQKKLNLHGKTHFSCTKHSNNASFLIFYHKNTVFQTVFPVRTSQRFSVCLWFALFGNTSFVIRPLP